MENAELRSAQAEFDKRIERAEKKARWLEEQAEEKMQRLDSLTIWDAISECSAIEMSYICQALRDYDHADAGLRLENIVRDYIKACAERRYDPTEDEE